MEFGQFRMEKQGLHSQINPLFHTYRETEAKRKEEFSPKAHG